MAKTALIQTRTCLRFRELQREGAYRGLEKLIKTILNDDATYKHI